MVRMTALAAGFAAAIFVAGAAAGDPTSRLIEVIGEKQTAPQAPAGPSIKVFRRKTCGSKQDLHLCGSFGVSIYPEPNKGTVVAPKITVKAEKGAKVLVTWTGSVFCNVRFGPPYGEKTEYVVSMQIQRGKAAPVEYNADGVNSVGRSTLNPGDVRENSEFFFDLHPVTLTRTFDAAKSGEEDYFGVFDVEIRHYKGSCNVNGGAMTAVVVD